MKLFARLLGFIHSNRDVQKGGESREQVGMRVCSQGNWLWICVSKRRINTVSCEEEVFSWWLLLSSSITRIVVYGSTTVPLIEWQIIVDGAEQRRLSAVSMPLSSLRCAQARLCDTAGSVMLSSSRDSGLRSL
jgi:hypothetical protein